MGVALAVGRGHDWIVSGVESDLSEPGCFRPPPPPRATSAPVTPFRPSGGGGEDEADGPGVRHEDHE